MSSEQAPTRAAVLELNSLNWHDTSNCWQNSRKKLHRHTSRWSLP
jgi:hypothetical protein